VVRPHPSGKVARTHEQSWGKMNDRPVSYYEARQNPAYQSTLAPKNDYTTTRQRDHKRPGIGQLFPRDLEAIAEAGSESPRRWKSTDTRASTPTLPAREPLFHYEESHYEERLDNCCSLLVTWPRCRVVAALWSCDPMGFSGFPPIYGCSHWRLPPCVTICT